MKKHGRRRGRGRGRRVGRFCHRIHYRLSAYQVSISSSGRPSREFLRLLFFLPLSFLSSPFLSIFLLSLFNFFPWRNLNCRLKISRRPWMTTSKARFALENKSTATVQGGGGITLTEDSVDCGDFGTHKVVWKKKETITK